MNLIYSALALFAFAGFAVTAKGADPEFGKEISRNNWEIATRFEDNVQCAGGHVLVGGKLKVEFDVHTRDDGRKVVVPKTIEMNGNKFLPKDASNGVGATGPVPLTFRVDRVEVDDLSFFGRSGSMVIRIFFVSNHNGVNTAQGDISPGNTFTFRAVYKRVEWEWNDNHAVKQFYYFRRGGVNGEQKFVDARCP